MRNAQHGAVGDFAYTSRGAIQSTWWVVGVWQLLSYFVDSHPSHLGVLYGCLHQWSLKNNGCLEGARLAVCYNVVYAISRRCRARCGGEQLTWSPYDSLQLWRDYFLLEPRSALYRPSQLWSICCWTHLLPCRSVPGVFTLGRSRLSVITYNLLLASIYLCRWSSSSFVRRQGHIA